MGMKREYKRRKRRGTKQQNLQTRREHRRVIREADRTFNEPGKSTRADGSGADPIDEIGRTRPHDIQSQTPVFRQGENKR